MLQTGGRVAITAPSGSAASSARSRVSTPRGLPRTSAVPTMHVTRSAGCCALSATSSGSWRFSTSSMSAPSEARFTTRHGVPLATQDLGDQPDVGRVARARPQAQARAVAEHDPQRAGAVPRVQVGGRPLVGDGGGLHPARRAAGRNAPTNRSPPARTRCRTASACSARSCRVGPIALPSLRRLRCGAAAAPLCPAVVLRVPDRARTPYAARPPSCADGQPGWSTDGSPRGRPAAAGGAPARRARAPRASTADAPVQVKRGP